MRRHNKPSECWPAAAVTLKLGVQATPQELRDCVKQRAAAYKYPHHVWLVDALPKGPTGKIVKREIAPRRTSHEDRHQRPGRGYHPCLI
jgi:acyl-coenzyme A synthetase/AMP-(fatty) acid ligase